MHTTWGRLDRTLPVAVTRALVERPAIALARARVRAFGHCTGDAHGHEEGSQRHGRCAETSCFAVELSTAGVIFMCFTC